MVTAAAALALMSLSTPTAAVTLDDLEQAERHVGDLRDELDAALTAYEQTLVDVETAREELIGLEHRASDLEQQARTAERLLSERARSAFKQSSSTPLEALLASGDPASAVARASMISALQVREGARLEDAVASRIALQQIRALVADRHARLQELEADLDRYAIELMSRLSTAESRAHSIRTMVARQVRIDRGVQQGIYACIFDDGFHFRDTWGDPRSGGRRHRGTDVMAPHNHPVYAFTSGTVVRTTWSALGGLVLYQRGDDGNVYLYAHLNSVEPGMTPGRRVSAGELIARNGSTGNASASAPHVHFELHPGGGAAINPYPWLAATCF
ncbi:MAG: peptidoglycan DD-metalloendopeptidase family protein [Nitriliruptoraceae bacterium]